ncbi:MAG TPA: amidase family protein [Stellaceae bacterium]|nr:amidase family protein [Stellaceae bacterium]
MTGNDELIRMTARQVVALLERRAVSPLELIDAALARIEAVDGAVNALPILCPERARDRARALAAVPPPEARRGWLAGLPLAIKDSMDVAGVRSTQGSPIYADHVPARSDLQVEALERKGGIVLARSNAPEFAAGSNTFNPVFGRTLNPWNTAMTCGGSSGGAAVAVATGEVWLANGTDLGGSLRIPASFCSVVGLRPSPGLVPQGPQKHVYDGLSVAGPMARNVGDLALMLDAMAAFDPRDPLSVEPPARAFADAVAEAASHPPRRIGFSRDLGFLPVDAEVADIAAAAAARFADRGAVVEAKGPDFRGASEIFQTLRAVRFAANYAPLLAAHRARIKPDVVWNVEKGLKLDGDAVGRALRERAHLYQRVAGFFGEYDLLATPAVIVPPFDVNQRYVEAVAGHCFDNYVDWLGMSYAVTLTGCPALSLPCGFTRSGLPVGLQLVGRPRGEAALLAAAALLEEQLALAALLPIDPRPRPG